jgi:hypothetical protein
MEQAGYVLRWSADGKVESWLLKGHELVYEIEKSKRVRRRIIRGPKDNPLILIGKKRDD